MPRALRPSSRPPARASPAQGCSMPARPRKPVRVQEKRTLSAPQKQATMLRKRRTAEDQGQVPPSDPGRPGIPSAAPARRPLRPASAVPSDDDCAYHDRLPAQGTRNSPITVVDRPGMRLSIAPSAHPLQGYAHPKRGRGSTDRSSSHASPTACPASAGGTPDTRLDPEGEASSSQRLAETASSSSGARRSYHLPPVRMPTTSSTPPRANPTRTVSQPYSDCPVTK